MTDTLPMTGGCQCGSVRYEVAEAPVARFVCHCTECRRQSASAFGISVYVNTAAVRITRGSPKVWSRPANSGDTVDCSFCPDCGLRLWHVGRAEPEITSIKGGSLDAPVDLTGAMHVWTSRRLPGVAIPPDAEQHAEEPPAG